MSITDLMDHPGTDRSDDQMRISIFSLGDNYPAMRKLDAFYAETIEMCEHAEALGLYGFFVAEHHFRESGTYPNPAILLSHLAARTRRIRLGPAVSVISLRDPRTVAEDYMMVNLLSAGRCMLGVGSGAFKFEFDGFDVPFEEKRGRFEEALAIIRQGIAGGVLDFSGSHHRASNVRINIDATDAAGLPMPLYVAGVSAQSAFQIGRAGDNLMNTPFISLGGGADLPIILSEYRRGLSESGSERAGDVAVLMHCHVAGTDGAARRRAAVPFERYIASRTDPQAPRKSYDEVASSDVALFGSVERIAERVAALAQLGISHLILFMNFGGIPIADVKDSMSLFASHVAPAVKQSIGG